MKRRAEARTRGHGSGARYIRYDDWPALIGGQVQIRLHGEVTQTGIVDEVMPDCSALWLRGDGVHGRKVFLGSDGYQVWISPRDLQTRLTGV